MFVRKFVDKAELEKGESVNVAAKTLILNGPGGKMPIEEGRKYIVSGNIDKAVFKPVKADKPKESEEEDGS